jgi:hypothetical protein
MRLGRASVVGWLVARLARLRFPTLFLLTAGLFLLDLLVPDLVPLADELLLGLATALLGSWRKRGDARAPHATSTGSGSAPGRRPGA